MMGYPALFWLVLHLRPGGAPALAAVDAALCLPMLLFSRRAGTIVAAVPGGSGSLVVTQALLAAASLAIGVPLLAGRMSLWYLVPLAFATGCVQCVDLPARQTLMLEPGRSRASCAAAPRCSPPSPAWPRSPGPPWPGSSSP